MPLGLLIPPWLSQFNCLLCGFHIEPPAGMGNGWPDASGPLPFVNQEMLERSQQKRPKATVRPDSRLFGRRR